MSDQPKNPRLGGGVKALYIISLAVLIFSGFGQMPIFKRYYLADLPGMAWSADFFTTLTMHYIAGAVFLGLVAYYLISRGLARSLWPLKSGTAWTRGILLLVLILTGALLAARNISGVYVPPNLIIATVFTHLAATMIFLLLAATWFRFNKNKDQQPVKK